jgi:hypothetical protein
MKSKIILSICLGFMLSVGCIQNKKMQIEIINPPSFSISNNRLIEITDSKMINACPVTNVLGEEGPEICKKEVTKITYFKIGDVTRLFACVGYSYDGAHFDPGQNGYILAEYKDSDWTIIDFLQVEHDGCWGNSIEIDNYFILGNNSFGYYSNSCAVAQGFSSCTSHIIGFVNDKIAVLLNQQNSEDNSASGEEPINNWHYNYKPIPSKNEVFAIEREYYKLDKHVETITLNYNPQSMKFE